MKAYLITTGILFTLLALAHVLRTVSEWSHVTSDPWFALEVPGLAVVAGAIAAWAWSLLRRVRPTTSA
jgi:hypothetical protein